MKKSSWFVTSLLSLTAAASFAVPAVASACPWYANTTSTYNCNCYRNSYHPIFHPTWQQQYWGRPTYNYGNYNYANSNYVHYSYPNNSYVDPNFRNYSYPTYNNANYAYPRYNFVRSSYPNYYRSW